MLRGIPGHRKTITSEVTTEKAADAGNETPAGRLAPTPDLPPGPSGCPAPTPSAQPPAVLGALMGRLRTPMVAVMLATSIGLGGCATAGAELTAPPPPVEFEARRAEVEAAPSIDNPETQQSPLAFADMMRRLQQMHAEGDITADQMARARTVLHRFHVEQLPGYQPPRDERGRVTLESVLRSDPTTRETAETRGERIMSQLARDIELRMQITARDMATGNYTPIDGLPGYKEPNLDDVQRLVGRALRNMPVGELPGGDQLIPFLQGLPGLAGRDVSAMSFEELKDEVGDELKDRLEARFKPIIEEHKIEAAVLAFSAVTGLRAASPEAAELIDDLGLRVNVWKERSDDGRLYTRGRLVWRDANVLPDLDIEGRATHPVGEHTTLRADLRGTLSIEGEPFTATASVGAHYSPGDFWLDTAATYNTETERWRATLSGGAHDPDADFRATSTLGATFGDGVAQGDSSGRVDFTLDLARDFDWGGATGSFGLYTGVSADTDFENEDVNAGVMFRLRW